MNDKDFDPVRLEVVKNALLAVTDEMSGALRRSAYSTNIKTRGDFSCALLDATGQVVAQSFSQPTHLGSLCTVSRAPFENLEPTALPRATESS